MDGGNSSNQVLLQVQEVISPTLAERLLATLAFPSSLASGQLQAFIHDEASRVKVHPVRAVSFAVACLVVFIILLTKTLPSNSSLESKKKQLDEPPLAPMSSSFFYHVGAIIRLGPSEFLQRIRNSTSAAKPYTVILGPTKASADRIYALNHPDDLRMLHRNAKSFSWLPFVLKYTKAFAGHAPRDEELVFSALHDPNSWFLKFVKMYDLMAVQGEGGYLDEANARAKSLLGEEISKLALGTMSSTKVELGGWLRKAFFRTTVGMYFGPQNFYEEAEDPERLLESYLIWEDNVSKLTNPGFDLYNRIVHRQVVARREELFAAHRKFLDDPERLEGALSFIRQRRVACVEAGYSLDGHTRSDMTLLFGSTANARNAIYWSIYHTFANKQLLSDIKAELATFNVVTVENGVGKINMPSVIDKCRYIRAVFHESLRMYQDSLHIRLVKDDVSVNVSDGNSYRLKKNGVVLVSGTNLYYDQNTWGDDVDVFNPYRFISAPKDKDAKRLQDAAFRPFGGGQTLCPGRKLAFAECASYVAALVSFFDIEVPAVAPRARERDGMGVLPANDDCIVEIGPLQGIKEVVFEW